MTDPLSIIALGAAVGGAAGKFTEKTWEIGQRWLSNRFAEHTEESKTRARKNAAQFVMELSKCIAKFEQRGCIASSAVEHEAQQPQFTVTLQNAIIRAAQTNEHGKHALLARLIAERLASKSESVFALASQMACDAVALATPRQLELLAMCSFLEDCRPRDLVDDPCKWLDAQLRLFTDFEFYEIDALHLMSLSCVSFERREFGNLAAILWMKFNPAHSYLGFEFEMFSQAENFSWLQVAWDLGLGGVHLTSVGALVGALVHDKLRGFDSELPSRWSA